uniref:Uncharacterized protein n=1 Tax=Chromera velia CCMP2878 TaxID=1169474 RepID=A0A0G4H4P6_9ALVE|eukprot:Cvel_24655.t1-p1 / transcript=Cvel_24655.t1 / gene=Cvel_24655 / organism=Chromera_velia_CCMP2878 / gene_product=hypothetical protein / transcript_product=hypothetical protein / location=Cvel_scaffold2695:3989-5832(+) / protein_length=289 / sequence_SO=supercontig / SO=protein_coding / is_pseudo=false
MLVTAGPVGCCNGVSRPTTEVSVSVPDDRDGDGGLSAMDSDSESDAESEKSLQHDYIPVRQLCKLQTPSGSSTVVPSSASGTESEKEEERCRRESRDFFPSPTLPSASTGSRSRRERVPVGFPQPEGEDLFRPRLVVIVGGNVPPWVVGSFLSCTGLVDCIMPVNQIHVRVLQGSKDRPPTAQLIWEAFTQYVGEGGVVNEAATEALFEELQAKPVQNEDVQPLRPTCPPCCRRTVVRQSDSPADTELLLLPLPPFAEEAAQYVRVKERRETLKDLFVQTETTETEVPL